MIAIDSPVRRYSNFGISNFSSIFEDEVWSELIYGILTCCIMLRLLFVVFQVKNRNRTAYQSQYLAKPDSIRRYISYEIDWSVALFMDVPAQMGGSALQAAPISAYSQTIFSGPIMEYPNSHMNVQIEPTSLDSEHMAYALAGDVDSLGGHRTI